MIIDPPKKIIVKPSPGKGLGVFATQTIFENEIIEECSILELPPLTTPELRELFKDYRFNYPQTNTIQEKKQVIALGYGSLYNHSDNNNAFWRDNPEQKGFQFIAARRIEAGEEICVYYGGDDYWNDNRQHIKLID